MIFSKDGERPKAIGVQVSLAPGSPSYRVSAKKEVILSGGVVGSAQVLLLSGIGPKGELEAVGVDCVKHLGSVGKHLSDVSPFPLTPISQQILLFFFSSLMHPTLLQSFLTGHND